MDNPSTRDYPAGEVNISDILTGEEYNMRTVELNPPDGEIVSAWTCRICGSDSGVQYGQSEDRALMLYYQHYARFHN